MKLANNTILCYKKNVLFSLILRKAGSNMAMPIEALLDECNKEWYSWSRETDTRKNQSGIRMAHLSYPLPTIEIFIEIYILWVTSYLASGPGRIFGQAQHDCLPGGNGSQVRRGLPHRSIDHLNESGEPPGLWRLLEAWYCLVLRCHCRCLFFGLLWRQTPLFCN